MSNLFVNKNMKINLIMALAIAIIFTICSIPMSVHAVEKPQEDIYYDGLEEVDGVYKYSIMARNLDENSQTGTYFTSYTSPIPIAYYWYHDSTYSGWQVCFYKDGELKKGYIPEVKVTFNTYTNREGETSHWPFDNTLYLHGLRVPIRYDLASRWWAFTSTAPIFNNESDAENYLKTLDDSLAINKKPVDIDSGLLDKNVGYLHNLHKSTLVVTDENGNPKDSLYKFTWSNSYPKYDDSYKIEVRAQCNVGVKGMFGLGKVKNYYSDIKNVHEGVYKNLQLKITNTELKNVFGTFIDEHMPPLHSLSVGAYQYSFYFRIYVYDESIKNYRFGQWVKISPDGTVFEGSINSDISAGDINQDGEWVIDPDTEYGGGIVDNGSGGVGPDFDSAEKDEEDGPDFDFSNPSSILKWFMKQLNNMADILGDFPSFINRIIGFLPSPVILFLSIGIVMVIILRFLGR